MEQYNADWYCSQCPFWVLSTQLDNPDFPESTKPEVMEVIEEALDIDATSQLPDAHRLGGRARAC